MFSTTTAILVVHRGGEQLSRVVEALAAQTRRPDQLAVVLADAPDVREVLTPLGAHTVIELHSFLSFGAAVEAAQRVVAGHPDDLMWVLSEDTIPAPDALEILATSLDTARSVAIAAPKLRNADDPDRLFGMGRTVTRFGRSVAIAVDELDQGQHDGLSDVLGVNPAGMLVRRSVWTSLGGIDPALTAVDDGLDLSVRARLAGHRVIVVPEARVDFAPGGVIGPPYGTARAMRRRARAERRAQLHRRLTWAPAAAVPLHWLSLMPLWIARSIGALLAKVPGRILPELSATLAAVFQWGRVASARRSIRRTRTTGWSSLLPLRAEPIELRRRARLDRDTQRAYGPRTDIDFLSTGGGWVLLGSLAASAIVFFWALAAPSLTGGGMLPLSSRLSVLWEHAASGSDTAGAADPFAAVLALLGSVTFWAPSFALVLLWLLAMPMSAMGAWFAVSRLHAPGAVRAVVAIGYAVAPPLLGALGDGRPGAVLAHSLLGWLTFALLGARRSWVAAGAAALLFAVISAAAPSLTPALVVSWLVFVGFAGRAAARLVLVIVPAVALWAPLVAAQLLRQTPVALLADPGVPLVQNSVSVGRIAAGLSDHQIAAWHSVLTLVHPAPDARWVLFLVLPLAFSAVGAVAVGRGIRGVLALGAALLGFATAVAAGQISVSVRADDAVAIWPGAGQSLMWLGLLVAASITLTAARGIRSVVAGGLAAVLMAYSLPLLIAIAAGRVAVHAGGAREMPALVAAEAERDPHLTTLVVSPTRDGGARLRLVEGAGEVLDSTSTLVATGPELTESERVFAAWAGDLITRADADPVGEAADVRLRFVLLRPGDGSAEQIQLGQRALAALDANGNLVPVGETEFGRLWRVADPGVHDAPATRPAGWIWLAQLAVIAGVLLLSIPTGTHVSAGQRLDRLVRQRGKKRVSPAAAVDASADDAAELNPDESDPVAMRNEESNG